MSTGTLLDTEELSSESLQQCVAKFDKVFTWETKEKILGLRKESWAPIVVAGEIYSSASDMPTFLLYFNINININSFNSVSITS